LVAAAGEYDTLVAVTVATAARPTAHDVGRVGLALGALGVVFGDIGTSPLYAVQTVFSIDDNSVHTTSGDVYGVISLIFWSVTIIVSVKYVLFILRADNEGEGGVLALAALARRSLGSNTRLIAVAMLLGVIGASLFYGDSVITPAISVLSAVEGIKTAAPSLHDVVLPVGIAILAVLFAIQRWGTHQVGRFFGPTMVLWFVVLAATGLPEIVRHPGILRSLSPTYAFAFAFDRPYVAFIAMGAVVLSITGAEALYADMGHFGRPPIRWSWFLVVFPALTLNYLGQGALILNDRSSVSSPFFLLVPSWGRVPMVVLATLATVIASQAVISGAYSVSSQAVRLGFLPQLTVRHTSERESGQIYVPAVNWLLFAGVLVLMLTFRSSAKLATAYGLAVTGTLLLTTTLFLVHAATAWHWAKWKLIGCGVLFGGLELMFLAANLTKVIHGGWLPLAIAAAIIIVMTTWQRGREIITARRTELEGPLDEFVEQLRVKPIRRVPGTAVFPHPTTGTTPLALRANVMFNQVLHEQIVIVQVKYEDVPHVHEGDRLTVDDVGYRDDGIVHVTARFGFQDAQHVPAMITAAERLSDEINLNAETTYYFLSRITIEESPRPGMPRWRKRLFIGLAHNAANPSVYFQLPIERTIVLSTQVEL
jgi:KUP system potassium uptake protein